MILGLGLLNQAHGARTGTELFEARVGARLVSGPAPGRWRVFTRGVLPPEWAGLGGFEQVVCGPTRRVRGGRLWSEQVSWMLALRRRPVDLLACPAFFPPRFATCPFVLTVHDLGPLERPGDLPAVSRLYWTALLRNVAPRARRISTPSVWVKERVASLLDYPAERIDVVYNGVEPGYFAPPPAARAAALLQRLDVRGSFWLHCGTVQPRKNLEVVIRTLGLLKQRGRDVPTLVSVGGAGVHRARLSSLARLEGVGERLVFAGGLGSEDLAALYAGCALFVFPSWLEGFGVPPLEAMACGAPVLASRATCLPEILGDAAHWADPAEPESWVSAWENVRSLSAPDREAWRGRGRERAARYSWDDTAGRWRGSLAMAAAELA